MSASRSRITRQSTRQKRFRQQVFRISFEDYEISSLDEDCNLSSIASSDEDHYQGDHESDTEIFTKSNSKKPRLGEVTSSSNSSQVDKNVELNWEKLGKKLYVSVLPALPPQTPISPQNENTRLEIVAYCFHQLFTQEMIMIDLITTESNAYAESILILQAFTWSKNVCTKKISSEEMKKYLGLRIALGLIRCTVLKSMIYFQAPFRSISRRSTFFHATE